MSTNPFFNKNQLNKGGTVLDQILNPNKPIQNIQPSKQKNIQKSPNKNIVSKNEVFQNIQKIQKNQNNDIKYYVSNQKEYQNDGGKKEKSPIKNKESPMQKIIQNKENKEIRKENINKVKILGISILNKNNQAIGEIKVELNQLSTKGSTKELTIISINRQYLQKCRSQWKQTIYANNCINLALHITNFQVLSQISKNPLVSIPQNIIYRLKQGFQFYQNQNQRDTTFQKILTQNKQSNNNIQICQKIQKIAKQTKIDRVLIFYFLINSNQRNSQNIQNIHKFILQDKINLLKIYRQLCKNGRLSHKKYVKSQQQTIIIQKIIRNYAQYYQQMFHISQALAIQLFHQLICFLTITFITHNTQVSQSQLTKYLLPQLKKLLKVQKIFSIAQLKHIITTFIINLTITWNGIKQIQQLQFGQINYFIRYYIKNNKIDINQLKQIMIGLAGIKNYQNNLQKYVQNKFINMIHTYQKQKCNKNIAYNQDTYTQNAIQLIFLIHQLKKIKTNNQFLPKILQLLYQYCPAAILSFVSRLQILSEYILPYVCKYYKQSSKTNKTHISLLHLNNNIPAAYALTSSSQNYLITYFLLSLLINYSVPHIHPQFQSLEDIQEILIKFNVSSIRLEENTHVLEIVRLINKYIYAYTKAMENRNIIKYQQQIKLLLVMVYKGLAALVMYYKDKHNNISNSNSINISNSNSNNSLYNNYVMLANCLATSCLINIKIGINISQCYRQILSILQQNTATQNTNTLIKIIVEIYKQWQYRIKNNNRQSNYMIYLCTINKLFNIIQQQQIFQVVLEIDNKIQGCRMINVMNEVIRFGNKQKISQRQKQLVQLGLVVFSYIVGLIQSFDYHSRQNMIIANNEAILNKSRVYNQFKQQIINFAKLNNPILTHIIISKLTYPINKQNPQHYIEYLELLYHIMILYKQHRMSHNKSLNNKSPLKIYSISQNLLIQLLEEQKYKSSSRQQIGTIIKMIFNLSISEYTSKIYILLCWIGFKFQKNILDIIIEQGYLDSVVKAIYIIIGIQSHKIKEYNKNNNKSKYIILGLNVYQFLYQQKWVDVTRDTGVAISKAIIYFINSNLKITNNQLIGWTSIILPIFSTNSPIKNLLSFFSIQQILMYLLSNNIINNILILNQSDKDNSRQTHVKLVHIIMVFISNDQNLSNFVKKNKESKQKQTKSAFFIGLFQLVVTLLQWILKYQSVGDSTFICKWIPVLCICLLKLSQTFKIMNMYTKIILPQNIIFTIYSLVQQQNKKTNSITKLSQQQKYKINQLLKSVIHLIKINQQFNKSITNKCYKNTYSHYNQALVTISMKNKDTFHQFFIGICQDIMNSEPRRSEKNIRIDSQDNQSKKKTKCYYLLYYFLQTVLEDQSGKYGGFFYQSRIILDSSGKKSIYQSLAHALHELITFLTQPILDQTQAIVLSWHIVLLNQLIKFYPQIMRKDRNFTKILQYCCNYMEYMQYIQNKDSDIKIRRAIKQDGTGLQNWIGFIEVMGIVSFAYRTHQYCDNDGSQLHQLRKLIFNRVKNQILNWQNIKTQNIKKFVNFSLLPYCRTTVASSNTSLKNFMRSYKLSLAHQFLQKQSQQKQNINSFGVYQYIKITMLLIQMCVIINLIKIDILSIFALDGFKEKLVDVTKQILLEFGDFYDLYFKSVTNSQSTENYAEKNIIMINQMIQKFSTVPQICSSQKNFNKILCKYIQSNNQTSFNPLLRKQTSKIAGSRISEIHSTVHQALNITNLNYLKDIGAIAWYNAIEENLNSMGYQCGFKFYSKPNQSLLTRWNGSSRMSLN